MNEDDKKVQMMKADIYGWDGYRLSVGDVSLGIVPQVGGRIMSLICHGQELFFVQDQYKGAVCRFEDVKDLQQEKQRLGFRYWGGDKTWVAPQESWLGQTPPLELDAGPYQIKPKSNGVELTSLPCRETGLQIIRDISFRDDQTIVLNQIFRNISSTVVTWGIWNVTQLLRPFAVYLPAKKEQIRVYRGTDLIEDVGHKMSINDDWVKVNCDDNTCFKVGGMIDQGEIVALRHVYTNNQSKQGQTIALVRSFDIASNAAYAHDAMAEVYNSAQYNYLEVEVHAPIQALKPDEECSHSQIWKVAKIDKIVGPDEVVDSLGLTR